MVVIERVNQQLTQFENRKSWVCFRHKNVYDHHAHIVLKFRYDRPNERIRAGDPKHITQNSQNQGFWKFWSIAAERLVCCCVWMRTLAVSFYSLVNLCIRSARRNLGYIEPERNAPIKQLNLQEIA